VGEDGAVIPTTIPHGRTARRLEWAHLPPHIRTVIERRTGSPVTTAESQTSGFTPGFASVLTCRDGSRHFVKAASLKAQRPFAESYREEARKLAGLPATTPAPRLLWKHDSDDWVVLGLEYVEARRPHRPWRPADLEAALGLVTDVAEALTPAPDRLALDDFEHHLRQIVRSREAAGMRGEDPVGAEVHVVLLSVGRVAMNVALASASA